MLSSWLKDVQSTILLAMQQVRMPPALEGKYLSHKASKVLQQRRLALFLAIFLWLVFLYWDFKHHFHFVDFKLVISIRLLGAVMLLAAFASSLSRHFLNEWFAEGVLLAATALAWGGILGMMLVSPVPNNYLDYYPGLLLIYVYLFAFLWIRVRKALALGTALFAVFSLVEWWMYEKSAGSVTKEGVIHQNEIWYYWWIANFYLVSFLMLGSIICYQLERFLRLNFLHEFHLKEETDRRESQSIELIALREQQLRHEKDLNEKKSGFLAAAAHDIRQPLMAVGATMEALNHSVSARDLESVGKFAAQAQAALRALRSTLNGVLEISQLESGAIRPKYSRLEIGELVKDVCEPRRVLADQKGVELRWRLPKQATYVRSDPDLLRRVIGNLVGNAIKYTPVDAGRRASVLLGVVMLGNRVRLDVYDTGVGILREFHEQIFQPFFQIDNKERNRERGLGLGLSIVAQAVQILDSHRLDFATVPGRGSRFSIEIPTSEDQSPDSLGAVAEPENASTSVGLSHSYVLVVDDDTLVSRGLVAALESWGAIVESCASLAQVTTFLEQSERNPDLVLTDFALAPNETGYDVINAVRTFCRRDVPAVILSGELNFRRRDGVSVFAVLSKPAEMKTLRSTLEACLASAAEQS
jgi:signal transduction histidine kinase/ActR/RegA family two-component response regulator